MPRKAKLQKLTVSLLKEGMTVEEELREPDSLSSHVVPALSTRREMLFIHAPPPHAPGWQSYLDRHVRNGLANLYSSGAAAILALDVGDRAFALTFGHGRHLINPDASKMTSASRSCSTRSRPTSSGASTAKNIDETTKHTALMSAAIRRSQHSDLTRHHDLLQRSRALQNIRVRPFE